MKLKDHFKNVGETISVPMAGLTVDVKVMDIKQSWGQVKYQITPVSGEGEVWIVAPEGGK
jgi:hypothetical protein